ncbi:MAG: hypothetical protein HYZ38_05110 [Mycobacterium sp.]|nr:hypothetical protein [Mycobacterium sp.]
MSTIHLQEDPHGALSQPCKTCGAGAGEPCEDYANGWIVAAAQPHAHRVEAARRFVQ